MLAQKWDTMYDLQERVKMALRHASTWLGVHRRSQDSSS